MNFPRFLRKGSSHVFGVLDNVGYQFEHPCGVEIGVLRGGSPLFAWRRDRRFRPAGIDSGRGDKTVNGLTATHRAAQQMLTLLAFEVLAG